MKNLSFSFSLITLILILSSCKKDWSCECTYEGGTSASTTNSSIENVSKSEAENQCNDSGNNGIYSYSCTLK